MSEDLQSQKQKWIDFGFTEREATDIIFCINYDAHFAHGADGHNRMLTVSRLSMLVDRLSADNAYWSEKIMEMRRDPEIGSKVTMLLHTKKVNLDS